MRLLSERIMTKITQETTAEMPSISQQLADLAQNSPAIKPLKLHRNYWLL